MRDNFYVVLPSNSSPLTQPNNSAASYLVNFESNLTFEGEWEVALIEYSFNFYPATSSFVPPFKIAYTKIVQSLGIVTLNVSQDRNILVQSLNPIQEAFLKVKLRADNLVEFTYSSAPFSLAFENEIDSKKWGFNTRYILSKQKTLISNNIVVDLIQLMHVSTSINITNKNKEEEKRYLDFNDYIQPSSNESLQKYFKQHGSLIFAEFIAKPEDKVSFRIKDGIQNIEMDSTLATNLGFDVNVFEYTDDKSYYTGQTEPLLTKHHYQYFIYSSIVEPILVGDNRVPLLRMIWLEPIYNINDVVFQSVDNLMYLPVSSKSINNIEVQIRSDSGDLIRFPYGSKSNITLHFRKHE